MNDDEIRRLFQAQVPAWIQPRERILLVVPDTTRTAPIARLIGLLYPFLLEAGAEVTILVALGTHPPLSEDVLRTHLGLDRLPPPGRGGPRVLNHAWNDPGQLLEFAELTADEVRQLSGGLMSERVPLRLNRAIAEADRMLILNPVFPHELVGFSGGSKYLYPGISGPDMISIVHWLGALRGASKTIGLIDTPSRRVLNAAALKTPIPVHGLSFVYHHGEVVAFEAGELNAAWRRAAEVSARVHVIYKQRPFRQVLACCPAMYPDLWTGGKCVYKCEPVVEDGGELIVYAPHVRCFSEVHDATITSLGYHLRDYFLAHPDRYGTASRAIMAYCVIVKGDGAYRDGVEYPRIRVTFATQIPRQTCEAAGIGYADPSQIDLAAWKNREDEGILCVEHAGEMLYRLDARV